MEKTRSCPHLGLKDDPQTCLGYPAGWNLCYHARPAAPVSLEHQRRACLSPAYAECPVFALERREPLPRVLRGARAGRRLRGVLLAAALALLALLAWHTWRGRAEGAFPLVGILALPFATRSVSTMAVPPVASSTAYGASPATRTPPPARTPSAAARASQTPLRASPEACGYELEGRIEANGSEFRLHRVRRGESVAVLEERYRTSLEAMQAVNYFLPSPLWTDLVIVLPAGNPDGGGLPVLEPFLAPEPGLPLAALAADFGLPPDDLARASGLDPDCKTVSGWVLVPRAKHRYP